MDDPSTSALNKVIEALRTRGHRPSSKKTSEDIPGLFAQTNSVINTLDQAISECKKYNEAKIEHRYEKCIHKLAAELNKVKEQLKLEQSSRPDSQKYITNLLDQMMEMKAENARLKKELAMIKSGGAYLQPAPQHQLPVQAPPTHLQIPSLHFLAHP